MELNLTKLIGIAFIVLLFILVGKVPVYASGKSVITAGDNFGATPKLPGFNGDSLARIEYDMGLKAEIAKAETIIAEEDYHRASLVHRKNTFIWQYDSGKWIFCVVVFIVMSGIIYSGIQFYNSIRHAIPDTVDAQTNVELSVSGIKITSSLIGILILVISIAFFYLYLIYVYPINQMKIDTEKQRIDMVSDKTQDAVKPGNDEK